MYKTLIFCVTIDFPRFLAGLLSLSFFSSCFLALTQQDGQPASYPWDIFRVNLVCGQNKSSRGSIFLRGFQEECFWGAKQLTVGSTTRGTKMAPGRERMVVALSCDLYVGVTEKLGCGIRFEYM